ncbi:hypothetical protein [Streptomyces hirsutus]|uniref:hypothetical protein n=1 Tax=Streptomyces hirsutus TaxID=35620 RepID=UPI003653784E
MPHPRREDRDPGRPWKPGPPVEQTPAAPAAQPIRIGYARVSIADQNPDPRPKKTTVLTKS